MRQTNYLKIFAAVAFLVLLGVSAWATVESLHLLLPRWPILLFWLTSIALFTVAAIGTKLIVDSFNQHIRIDNRGWRIVGGSILVIIFWIFFSLPTNTHTFFYQSAVKDVLIRDLTETKSKLQDLSKDGEAGKIIEQERADFESKVNAIFGRFAAEINNHGNPGWGDRANKALEELESELGTIQKLTLRSKSLADRQRFIEGMRRQKDERLASKIKSVYDTRLSNINKGLDKETIGNLIRYIDKVEKKIEAKATTHDEPTVRTINMLSRSYKIIEKYSDVLIVNFDKKYPQFTKIAKEDKVVYAGVSKTEKMRSVIDVWKDYFAGKYAGRGFLFWIIIAALIDIAGFIFFDIAFARKE